MKRLTLPVMRSNQGPLIKKSTTITDVAKKAGVSIATVSFVMNQRSGQSISTEVKARVLRAARQLSYHPTAAATDLARKRTNNVAIIFHKEENLIANQFYSFVIQGAVKQAIESEYNVLFSYMDPTCDGVSDLPKVIREKNAQGALFIRRIQPKLLKDLSARGIPVVAIDHYPAFRQVNSLHIDNRRGGILAAEHLIQLGHRRLSFLHAAGGHPSIAERGKGFALALERHGVSGPGCVIACPSLSFESGYESAKAALRAKRRPSALFCSNDEMAAGVLRAARELGRRVPDDLSVVGFDDIAMSYFTDPPLTTVSVVKEELGRRAMARLLQLLAGVDDALKHETVEVDLVVRGSTGPYT
jgi:DNA-binding LacI/PurR family transcriptional regulator